MRTVSHKSETVLFLPVTLQIFLLIKLVSNVVEGIPNTTLLRTIGNGLHWIDLLVVYAVTTQYAGESNYPPLEIESTWIPINFKDTSKPLVLLFESSNWMLRDCPDAYLLVNWPYTTRQVLSAYKIHTFSRFNISEFYLICYDLHLKHGRAAYDKQDLVDVYQVASAAFHDSISIGSLLFN